MKKLFETYSNEPGETGFLEIFREKVTCSSADWKNWGSGDGAAYQELSKKCPAFHVEFSAIGLRTIRKHWGPVNRKELELRKDAADLLRAIEAIDRQEAAGLEPPVPLSWAEKTTAAIIEAIAPVILDVLENSAAAADPHPYGHERDHGTSTRPAESPEAIPAPVEERQADWSDVATAVMPRLTQQQILDIFMQMLRPAGEIAVVRYHRRRLPRRRHRHLRNRGGSHDDVQRGRGGRQGRHPHCQRLGRHAPSVGLDPDQYAVSLVPWRSTRIRGTSARTNC